MFSNRMTVAALAVACVAAAGAGGYFATRQNTVPAPVVASSPSDAVPFDHPVKETEAVVAEAAPKTVVPPSAPARRAEPAHTSTAVAAAKSTTAVARPNLPSLERPWPSNAPT